MHLELHTKCILINLKIVLGRRMDVLHLHSAFGMEAMHVLQQYHTLGEHFYAFRFSTKLTDRTHIFHLCVTCV